MNEDQIKESLLNKLGLAGLSEEKQAMIIGDITETLLKAIFLETMDKLGEDGRAEYEKLVEGGAFPEEIEKFLDLRIGGYPAMVEKVIVDFITEISDENKDQ